MQVIVSLLLAVFFLFALERGIDGDFIARLNQFMMADWLVLLFAPALFIVLRWHLNSGKQRMRQRDTFLSLAAAATIALPLMLSIFKSESASAVIVSAYMASVGWIYTNYNSIRNQRKAHTMTVLIQLRNSTEYHKHRANVFRKFPIGRGVTPADIAPLRQERADPASWSQTSPPVIESMTFILNYFEFMSIGVWNEDLDEAMIKDSMRGIFKTWHQHLAVLIADTRKTSPRAFCNFVDLVKLHERGK